MAAGLPAWKVRLAAAGDPAPTLTTQATAPPLRKNWLIAYEASLRASKPPNTASNWAWLVVRTAVLSGPRAKKSTNAVFEVLTPEIVRTPLGISST